MLRQILVSVASKTWQKCLPIPLVPQDLQCRGQPPGSGSFYPHSAFYLWSFVTLSRTLEWARATLVHPNYVTITLGLK